MISFILNFCSIDKGKFIHIPGTWESNNYYKMVSTTIKVIKNIQQHKFEHEIILIDNSHNWPNITLSNVRVIKGFQSMTMTELENNKWFNLHNDTTQPDIMTLANDTMWASLGFYLGTKEAKYDTIVLQHNDLFYYNFNAIEDMIYDMKADDLSYISVDSKKVTLISYVIHQELFDRLIDGDIEFSPEHAGMVKTKDVGFSDAYFFLCKKDFFRNYDIDWIYGDSNHGATIHCLEKGYKYLHLGPYYDNPNYETQDTGEHNIYYYDGLKFASHLKGGFSENKISTNTNSTFYEALDETI